MNATHRDPTRLYGRHAGGAGRTRQGEGSGVQGKDGQHRKGSRAKGSSRGAKDGRPPGSGEDAQLWRRVVRSVDPLDARTRGRAALASGVAHPMRMPGADHGPPAIPPLAGNGAGRPIGRDGTLRRIATANGVPSPASGAPAIDALQAWWNGTEGGGGAPAGAGRSAARGPTSRGAGRKDAASPVQPLDRPTARKLGRRHLPIEGRIDLHGAREAQAHARLLTYLRRARAEGLRHVIVITGKGRARPGADGGEAGGDVVAGPAGVLRRAVPQWFATPPFRDLVSGCSPASRRDGGEGALYVKLRR